MLDHCQEAGGQLSLHFSRVVLVPAAAAATSAGAGSQVQPAAQPACEPLHLLVDEEFAGRSLRVQVFGRQPSGANFAAPHAFRAEGRDLAAALDVQRQWQEYQQRHQAARASAGQPVSESNFAHSSTLAVQSGEPWQGAGAFPVGVAWVLARHLDPAHSANRCRGHGTCADAHAPVACLLVEQHPFMGAAQRTSDWATNTKPELSCWPSSHVQATVWSACKPFST